jgi:hypothetical protein
MIGIRIVPPRELDAIGEGHDDVRCRLAKLPGREDRALLEAFCRDCGAVSVVVIDVAHLELQHEAWISLRGARTLCLGVH